MVIVAAVSIKKCANRVCIKHLLLAVETLVEFGGGSHGCTSKYNNRSIVTNAGSSNNRCPAGKINKTTSC